MLAEGSTHQDSKFVQAAAEHSTLPGTILPKQPARPPERRDRDQSIFPAVILESAPRPKIRKKDRQKGQTVDKREPHADEAMALTIMLNHQSLSFCTIIVIDYLMLIRTSLSHV